MKRETMKHQQQYWEKNEEKEIKMEKLLFANVQKFCNKILFNLFVVNFKLHFYINVEYKVAFLSLSRS
jgi:hypothetical protein